MKTYFFLKSGFISAVMFLVCSFVAAHAGAQGRILTAGVKIAEIQQRMLQSILLLEEPYKVSGTFLR